MAAAEKSGATRDLRVLGRVVPEDTRIYRINSGMEGFVRETYNDSVGMLVKKDQRLATYYGPDSLSVASGFLAATASVPGAVGRDGNRTMPFPGAVSKQGVSSLQGYTDRLRNLGMSDAQIKQMAESRQLPESVDVVSPVDGFILGRNVTPGEHFDRSTEFYRIADLSRVWIIAEIFENEAQYFRPGTVARVTLQGQQRTFPARISNVLPEVDPATRTLKLRMEANNPGFALRPDMFVDVELPVHLPAGLSIPADALIDSGLKKRVFVESGPGMFEPREVETGWRFGDRIQITSGLHAGDRVVSAGTFLLDSESKIETAAARQPDKSPAAIKPDDSIPKNLRETALELKPNKIHAGMTRDPKCGMEVDSSKATAEGHTLMYLGRTYYFCSNQCKDEFRKSPKKYLDSSGETGGAPQ
jgi:Cu(I)/Ag(I) efflux system membrane fusion protein